MPPDALVENLPVGAQQKVEILKALMRDAQVLILDEPTAVLTPQETEGLFKVIRSLAESGRSVLFITHKLKEVLAVADKITVMRLGKVVGHTTPRETNEPALAAMMVGRSVDLVVSKAVSKPGPPVLELKDLTVQDERGLTVVDHVSLTVHSGEIVALAGVQGNGQTELTEAVTGLRSVASGTIRLAGRDLTNASPRRALRAGIANIPEDRQIDGLVLSLPISDNLVLDVYDQAPYAHLGARRLGFVRRDGEHKLTEFDIRANSVDTSVGTLSGGNQQKVVVARELSHGVTQLVASQPTRGLDVGSIEYVHRRIIDERDRGAGVLLVSSELDEVLALGDRIAVMYRGPDHGIVPPNVSRDRIGLMMAGVEDGATTTPGGGEPLTTADVARQGTKVRARAGAANPETPVPHRADAPKPWWLRALRWMTEANVVVVTICAVIFGLFVGAILIIVTTPATLHAWSHCSPPPATPSVSSSPLSGTRMGRSSPVR